MRVRHGDVVGRHRHVEVARAVAGDDLAVGHGDDVQLDADLRRVRLDVLGEVRVWEGVADDQLLLEAVRIAGLRQQLLGLVEVELERLAFLVRERAEGADRHQRLTHATFVLHGRLLERVVVDHVLHGLANLRVRQDRVVHVEGDVVELRARRAHHLRGLARLDAGEVVAVQHAGHVDVALLELQAFGGGLRHMTHDDAAHLGRAAPVAVVARQHDRVVGGPAGQLEGAGTGGVGAEPLVGMVAVDLVLERFDLVEHEGAAAGEDGGADQRLRITLVEMNLEGRVVLGDDGLLHVVLVDAPLGDDVRRVEVQQHETLQRPLGVLGRHRVARVVLDALAHLEGPDLAVLADRVAFGHARDQLLGAAVIGQQQRIADVVHDLVGRRLADLRRIEGVEIVQIPGDDKGVLRRCRAGGRRQARRQEGGSADDCADVSH